MRNRAVGLFVPKRLETPVARLSILLVGNYAIDRQESMQRFSALLLKELNNRGVNAACIQPEPILGRIVPNKWFGYVDKLMLFPRRLKKTLAGDLSNRLVHICDHSNAPYVTSLGRHAHLVTCHDLLAIRSARGEIPENPTSGTGKVYQRFILKGLNSARRVACVSNKSREDLLRISRLRPEQTSVAYNGLNYDYKPMPVDQAQRRVEKLLPRAPKRFILHVGGNQWYKNRPGVVRLYHSLASNAAVPPPDLILVGKPWPEALRNLVHELNLSDKIHAVHGAENEDIRALYSLAEAFVFPSLMEGFGWPVIEAQACGCPVVASDVAPLTEIGGDAALYADPRQPASFANELRQLLSESGADRERRRARSVENASRFSTGRMIDRYLEEYEIVLNQQASQ